MPSPPTGWATTRRVRRAASRSTPMDHLDPLGTLMMAVSTYTGFGIGWGKPVHDNPGNLRRIRAGTCC